VANVIAGVLGVPRAELLSGGIQITHVAWGIARNPDPRGGAQAPAPIFDCLSARPIQVLRILRASHRRYLGGKKDLPPGRFLIQSATAGGCGVVADWPHTSS